jgi:heme/copper-type cytochrome/quinol oxidase subunit 2
MRQIIRHAFVTLFLLGAPRAALACPVCFGQSDAPMAKAMNMGIMLMLVVIVGVLGAFASFIISLARRARLAEMAAAERHEPQEGTVQC